MALAFLLLNLSTQLSFCSYTKDHIPVDLTQLSFESSGYRLWWYAVASKMFFKLFIITFILNVSRLFNISCMSCPSHPIVSHFRHFTLFKDVIIMPIFLMKPASQSQMRPSTPKPGLNPNTKTCW